MGAEQSQGTDGRHPNPPSGRAAEPRSSRPAARRGADRGSRTLPCHL